MMSSDLPDNDRSDFEKTEPLSAEKLRDHIAAQDLIGPYRLLEKVGSGGMGVVWKAEQLEPVKRVVALKVIRAGLDSKEIIARFDAERQALALMNHPNIARIIDAGTTEDGQPYFAMEFVDGKPLTQYCDENQLDIDQRLRLFMEVCAGVQHAHQKGIIHRDLKPGNILVSEVDGVAVPKVIDFGLAKATQSSQRLSDATLNTKIGQILGTLKYMSPEQANVDEVDIDTRTDVYALGVILYELLTGGTPLDERSLAGKAVLKVMEMIRDQDPVKPSRHLGNSQIEDLKAITQRRKTDSTHLNRVLEGDLDWIVMKSLERDRNRRYESASGFAADIGRYLDSEPVTARPPSVNYRIRKFVRKNKSGVFAVSSIALALLIGIVLATIGFVRAENKRVEAEKNLEEANRQRSRAEKREKLAVDAVKRFGDSVTENQELQNNPSLFELRKTLLREPLEFFKSLREMLQVEGDNDSSSLEKLADAALEHGMLADELGSMSESLTAYDESIEIWSRLGANDPNNPMLMHELSYGLRAKAVALSRVGRNKDAIKVQQRALDILESLVKNYPDEQDYKSSQISVQTNMGTFQLLDGNKKAALDTYQNTLGLCETFVIKYPNHREYKSDLSTLYNNMGKIYDDEGNKVKALEWCEKTLRVREQLASEDPDDLDYQDGLASACHNIAKLNVDLGMPEKAAGYYQKSINIKKMLCRQYPAVVEYQRSLADTLNGFAKILSDQDKTEQSIEKYQEAIGLNEKLAMEHSEIAANKTALANSFKNVAIAFSKQDQPEKASEYFKKSISIYETLIDENPGKLEYQELLSLIYSSIGGQKKDSGEPIEALEAFTKSYALVQALSEQQPENELFKFRIGEIENARGYLEAESGEPKKAVQLFKNAVDILEDLVANNIGNTKYRSKLASAYNNYSAGLGVLGQNLDGLKVLKKSIALQEELISDNPGDTRLFKTLVDTMDNLDATCEELGSGPEVVEAMDQQINTCRRMIEIRSDPKSTQLRLAYVIYWKALLLIEDDKNAAEQLVKETNELIDALISSEETDSEFLIEIADLLDDMAILDIENQRYEDARNKLVKAIDLQKELVAEANGEAAFETLGWNYENLKSVAIGLGNDELLRQAYEGIKEIAMADSNSAALEKRITEIKIGDAEVDPENLLALAFHCYNTMKFGFGVKMYRRALEISPELYDDRDEEHLYYAACCAALAASEFGNGSKMNESEKKQLRLQSLSWLKMELEAWESLADSDTERLYVKDTMEYWQSDPDLRTIRDAKFMELIDEDERVQWEQLWQEVDQLLKRCEILL